MGYSHPTYYLVIYTYVLELDRFDISSDLRLYDNNSVLQI